MKITIEIDDNELRERVTELAAKKLAEELFDRAGNVRYMFSNDVKKIVRTVIDERIDTITDKAVDAAARSIEHRGVKKLVDKLSEDLQEE